MVSMKLTSALAALILATPMMVSASPYPREESKIPADAARLAFDETTHQVVAYDASGKEIGKFDPKATKSKRDATGACSNLSADDVQKLPGWSKLKDQAEKNWGKGSYNVVTNDKDFVDQPGQVCVDDKSMTIEPDGDKQCQDSKQTTGGSLVGSNGTVVLTYAQGTTLSSQNTVTKESSIAVGVEVSMKFSIPEVFEIGGSVSTTTTFKNSLSNSQTAQATSTQTSSITQNAPAGKKCSLEFNNHSCNINGKGKVRFSATGWVWFEYNDKTQGHYKWALPIESTLTNIDDRSEYSEFKAAIKSQTTSDYKGVCS